MISCRSLSIRKILLSLVLFMLACSNLDFAHASAGYTLHGVSEAASAPGIEEWTTSDRAAAKLIEELDDSDKAGAKRRLPVAVANSVSLNSNNLDSSTSQVSGDCALTRPLPCPTEVKVISWREKEKGFLESVKAQPIWLRLGVLLI